VDAWYDALLPVIAPLTISAGGPILMVQVENEYGSYGSTSKSPADLAYMRHLKDALHRGLPDTQLFTTDGGDTWTLMGGTPQQTMSIFFTDPDTGYAVSYTGQAVRSVDGGITWNNLLPDILNATVGDAAWVDGAIVIGCNNGDIFRAQVTCPATADVPVINDTGATLCVSTAGSALWYLDGSILPGGDTPCIEPVTTGLYTVVVSDPLGCVSAPSAPVQVIITGLASKPEPVTRIFPNPAKELLRIERSDAVPATLTFINAQGRIVHSTRVTGATSVDVSGLRPGVYLVRVASGSAVESFRLVKE
jgi:hypothetical protein